MIIGLVGFIGSGKSTAANILVREHGYEKFAFADALKDAVSHIFQWDRQLLEGETTASRAFRERTDPWWSYKLGYEVTPRLILQKMGTEACRQGIADNIWIAALEKRIQGNNKVVVTDVRFVNEMEFIRSVGGKLIWIKRGEVPSLEKLQEMHVSETAWYDNRLAVDYMVENNGTMDKLSDNLSSVLTTLANQYTIQNDLI